MLSELSRIQPRRTGRCSSWDVTGRNADSWKIGAGKSAVLADLFDPEGSEIHLRPVSSYVEPGRPVNFYTVVESARQQDEIALGYHVQAHANDGTRNHGVVLNPNKHETVTFAAGDRIVILNEA